MKKLSIRKNQKYVKEETNNKKDTLIEKIEPEKYQKTEPE
jgi:hypothetical protein